MKWTLQIALLFLAAFANAQLAKVVMVPNNTFNTIECDTEDSFANLHVLDGRVVRVMWLAPPENPPEQFGIQSTYAAPSNTSALEIRIASTSLYGDVVDQTVQVFDFVAGDWVTVSTTQIGGGNSMELLTIVVTSPVAIFPSPFLDPETGDALTRVLWNGQQTPGVILDMFNVRAFNGN